MADGFSPLTRNGSDPLYNPSARPTPVRITLASLRQHIIDANGGGNSSEFSMDCATIRDLHRRRACLRDLSPPRPNLTARGGIPAKFDIFAHSWAPDLEAAYRDALPLAAAEFEDNRPYQRKMWAKGTAGLYNRSSDWHQLSYALSMAKAASLVLAHAERRWPPPRFYDRVVFARADVLLTRDLRLASLPPSASRVYVSGNSRPATKLSSRPTLGDLHYVFSTREQLQVISRLPELLQASTEAHVHNQWSWRVLVRNNFSVHSDGFIESWDEGVYRKLRVGVAMRCKGRERFRRYGIDDAEWDAIPHPASQTDEVIMKHCKREKEVESVFEHACQQGDFRDDGQRQQCLKRAKVQH